MRGKALYTIEKTVPSVVLVDRGNWSDDPTITNNIEDVVKELVSNRILPASGKELLFYFDSEGELSGAVVEDGVFKWFFHPNDADRRHLGV